jgi:hypothetical protein
VYSAGPSIKVADCRLVVVGWRGSPTDVAVPYRPNGVFKLHANTLAVCSGTWANGHWCAAVPCSSGPPFGPDQPFWFPLWGCHGLMRCCLHPNGVFKLHANALAVCIGTWTNGHWYAAVPCIRLGYRFDRNNRFFRPRGVPWPVALLFSPERCIQIARAYAGCAWRSLAVRAEVRPCAVYSAGPSVPVAGRLSPVVVWQGGPTDDAVPYRRNGVFKLHANALAVCSGTWTNGHWYAAVPCIRLGHHLDRISRFGFLVGVPRAVAVLFAPEHCIQIARADAGCAWRCLAVHAEALPCAVYSAGPSVPVADCRLVVVGWRGGPTDVAVPYRPNGVFKSHGNTIAVCSGTWSIGHW